DVWHADEDGEYDNAGSRYRGHQFTDAEGRYRFETIVPALYSGRTRHYHVKIQPKGGRLVTTQLYFPGEPMNRRDGLYRPELELKPRKWGGGASAFVVEAWRRPSSHIEQAARLRSVRRPAVSIFHVKASCSRTL